MKPFFQSQIDEKEFHNQDLTSQQVEEVTFRNCTFSGCQMSETKFQGCGFINCQFLNCDLSLVTFPQTYFEDTTFEKCRMMGINWCQADWEAHSLLVKNRIDFEGCLLDHSLFIGLDLGETNFLECKARHVDFESANLLSANFEGADLEGARFINCDLSGANFSGAVNYAINAGQNKLHKTRFSLPEALSLLHCLDIILDETV